MNNKTENKPLELAYSLINYTDSSIFLTGKAGTGKTTFLRKIQKEGIKRTVVLAPTGVAAINAGGVTIHSFFQLPFTPFLPGKQWEDNNDIIKNFRKEKLKIIRSIELLVIDEISMVRADLLDSIDFILRKIRRNSSPFGGVQLLMIGDLQQLPPVVKEDDWNLLKTVYSTEFFFGSLALQKLNYTPIELKHIYRQKDQQFITILNEIRENCLSEESIKKLNKRYVPDFKADIEKGFITLTTHNNSAQAINNRKMEEITERPFSFKAITKGIFPSYSFPTDEILTLKKGAQVMFVKNDSTGKKRYYNGKIGIVSYISKQQVRVTIKTREKEEEIDVTPEIWTNARYKIDKTTNKITEVIDGTFQQIPLKQAWAITIHKSQGLTFEHAFIDANAAFTHGQVYVALSRCRSLEGLVLNREFNQHAIKYNTRVLNYNQEVNNRIITLEEVNSLQQDYFIKMICELFDYTKIQESINHIESLCFNNLKRLYPKLVEILTAKKEELFNTVYKVSETFKKQLTRIIYEETQYKTSPLLNERIIKASNYFLLKQKELILPLLEKLTIETDNKELKERLEKLTQQLCDEIEVKEFVLIASKEGFNLSTYMKTKAQIIVKQTGKRKKAIPKKKLESAQEIEVIHPELYNKIRLWRNKKAKEENVPAYIVLRQIAIVFIANERPKSSKELLKIPSVGKKTLEKYGKEILDIIFEDKAL